MIKITVGTATCGNAAGAQETLQKLQEITKDNKDIQLAETGCIGMCYKEPLVEININNTRYIYGNVNPKIAEKIYSEHVLNDKPFKPLLIYTSKKDYQDTPLFTEQKRIVLRNVGVIDPENIDDYIKDQGYKGLEKALNMDQEKTMETLTASGLRGRGGAGFLTGIKWKLTYEPESNKKYVICNADEGDPGAFMDRSTLEGDPHSVLEGMLICGYSIGADEGYIYCRAEYPLAIKRLETAISQAKKKNLIGKNILGTDFSFDIHIKEGAGAFVCGEESALIASIEGKRGMPRIRPPYPSVKGLWGKPTNINNVETYANVPWIINNGSEAYKKYGTKTSKGTKVFALAGKINNSGLIEVEMGKTIKEIIFDIGGGIKNNKQFKAVQLGGPSGGCLPASLVDTPVDYESLSKYGAIVGSGGMVVLDEDTCMVDVAKYFLNFTQNESCGKCTFCRLGTKRMLEILSKISEGNGKESDIQLLEDLAQDIKQGSLCGLGQTAPNPVLTTIKYFKEEYLEHINEKKCRAGVCAALIRFEVVDAKCIGCGACKTACPVNAVSGELKKIHKIDQKNCIQCGACYTACRYDAILKE